MDEIMTEKRKDLFKNTYRSSMALTIDYVFHAVFGRDTDESKEIGRASCRERV